MGEGSRGTRKRRETGIYLPLKRKRNGGRGHGGIKEWEWWLKEEIMVVYGRGHGGIKEWEWWLKAEIMVVYGRGHGGMRERRETEIR